MELLAATHGNPQEGENLQDGKRGDFDLLAQVDQLSLYAGDSLFGIVESLIKWYRF